LQKKAKRKAIFQIAPFPRAILLCVRMCVGMFYCVSACIRF